MSELKRLGFLASGRGSNLQAIIDACEKNELDATPVLVISNNPNAQALQRGADHGLATVYLSRQTHPDAHELDREMSRTFRKHDVDLVILAGYMKKIGPELLAAYPSRVINIHPSLLPRYGGQGMYGMYIHEAVIAAGDEETGVTIHLVNDEYDRGKILAQCPVRVEPGDDAATLASRVLEVEHRFYVEVLEKIINGEICLPE